jgi:hypothetical protein
MTSENNNERIRQAVERGTPPPSPEVRKRALCAAMAAMRRRSPVPIVIVMVLVLLLLAGLVYLAPPWFPSGENWLP